ncbi:segregation/condensation protein A [Candidatus Falkowbacteria bacterium]|nr:segregation/condensation protein A [Candidatus Falkowbacteria bacterium]
MPKYTVTTDQFNGPLELLLQIIEEQQLEITKVSLAAVADQYILYLQQNPQIPPDEIADFLVIASKLILIKSKALLPTLLVEDEDAIDLERQLKMYKQFVEASHKISEIAHKKQNLFTKDSYPQIAVEGFITPRKPITQEKLHSLFSLLLQKITPPQILEKKIIEKVVTIKEKISHIKDLLMSHTAFSFKKSVLVHGSRSEKIVSFLAILELAKQKMLDVEQGEYLGDIVIKKNVNSDLSAIALETEFSDGI